MAGYFSVNLACFILVPGVQNSGGINRRSACVFLFDQYTEWNARQLLEAAATHVNYSDAAHRAL
jgi:hypothetical protein